MSNYTQSLNGAIDRLQEALEEARDMPRWGVALTVLVALLCAIILLHVIALLAATPCLYGMWKKRQRDRERLLNEAMDEDTYQDTDGTEILDPPSSPKVSDVNR